MERVGIGPTHNCRGSCLENNPNVSFSHGIGKKGIRIERIPFGSQTGNRHCRLLSGFGKDPF